VQHGQHVSVLNDSNPAEQPLENHRSEYDGCQHTDGTSGGSSPSGDNQPDREQADDDSRQAMSMFDEFVGATGSQVFQPGVGEHVFAIGCRPVEKRHAGSQ
jgi:hypothetical protein